MTDGQLIALVEETTPDELSHEQIALLRRRLPHSPELREAIASQLRLEQALNAALATPHVSIDWIIAQAALQTASTSAISRLFGWGPATALAIAVTTTGVLLQRHWAAAPAARPAQAAMAPRIEQAALRIVAEPPAAAAPVEAADEQPSPPETASPSDNHALDAPANGPAAPAMVAPAAAPAPDAAAAVQEPAEPLAAESLFFQELAWQGFEPLEQRLAALEGAHERREETASQRAALKLAAVSQLSEAWPEGAALRLRLGEAPRFRLHLWNGTQGLTLERSSAPRPAWGAYRATRRASDLRPQSLALWATDADRYRRLGQGTVDLRWHAGELTLCRGDVCLLAVPCPKHPENVVLEGPAELCGLEFVACAPLELGMAPAADDAVAEPTPPAKLSWSSYLPPGAQWNALAEGRGELLAEDTAELAWVATEIADPGLHELIFQLEDPLPGTGVFLGDRSGRPLAQLGFFRDEASGQTYFGFATPGDARTTGSLDLKQGPAPFAGQRPWLRLVCGGGWLRCWTSGDGRHWSPAVEPLGGIGAGYATAGLYALPGGGTRCLRIRRFEARRLPILSSLAPAALRAQVSGMIDTISLGAWQQTVAQSCPPGIEPDRWRTACAVELLASGARPELTSPVLLELLEQTLADDRLTGAERLALLDEAALLIDASDSARLQAFLGCYERLAQALAWQGERRPYATVLNSLLTSPLTTPLPFDALPPALVGRELAELTAEGDAAALRALGVRLEYYCGHPAGRGSPPEAQDHAEVRRLLAEAIERINARQVNARRAP